MRNESTISSISPKVHNNPATYDVKNKTTKYQDLCLGSVSGLFLGCVVGKFSSLLVFLALSTYFFLEFLESRGIITVPWNSVLAIGSTRLDLKDLIFKRASFKLSFSAAFLIAAFNI